VTRRGDLRFTAHSLFNKGDAKLFLEAKTTATFSAPGDTSCARRSTTPRRRCKGEQCCWTTAHVKVIVNQSRALP